MMSYKKSLIAIMLANVGITAASAHGDHSAFDELLIGTTGDAQSVTRTINIDLSDEMRFTPANITAEKNETVRFVVTNKGKVRHEFRLGTARRLKEQYESVKRNPGMEIEAPYRISVAPGASGEIVWKFSHVGIIIFACLQPGHLDAGMIGGVTVTTAVEKT